METFKKLSNKTSLDEFGKFDILGYTKISNSKATRLSELHDKSYPEPYILEVLERTGHNEVKYKAFTFSSLEEAEEHEYILKTA